MSLSELNTASAEAVLIVERSIGLMLAEGFTVADVRAVLPELWRSAQAVVARGENTLH